MSEGEAMKDLSGKDLDEQSGGNLVLARAQGGHEGEEQSAVLYRTYSFQEGVGCRITEWCQVVKRGAEQPGEFMKGQKSAEQHEATK